MWQGFSAKTFYCAKHTFEENDKISVLEYKCNHYNTRDEEQFATLACYQVNKSQVISETLYRQNQKGVHSQNEKECLMKNELF